MDVLKIDGVVMPKVKSLSVSREAIWSKNAGRGSTGKFIGDIVARKYTLQVVFCPMNDAEAVTLSAALFPDFFEVNFRDPATGSIATKTMYAGTPTYPVYSYVDKYPRYEGVGVKLVEQ